MWRSGYHAAYLADLLDSGDDQIGRWPMTLPGEL